MSSLSAMADRVQHYEKGCQSCRPRSHCSCCCLPPPPHQIVVGNVCSRDGRRQHCSRKRPASLRTIDAAAATYASDPATRGD
ncbi:unnamed protein product [Macrosiphum euphorbiae]|uniref:Uncharacterized protein n=1 Tax=Macrosiphum euphorbiae TaxID=13131 RepID=A0AAV0XXT5_9HEMI|nr:unnamed protein product [Macrosiphum euphorbiae]